MTNKCYQQTTYESCLSVSLMLLTGIKPTIKKELAIWKSGWYFNFLIGQLNYIGAKYRKKLLVYVENKKYFNNLREKTNKQIYLRQKKVDCYLIDYCLKINPVIIYIDNYCLQKQVHAPHFIVILSKKDDIYVVSDPYDGKIKKIPRNMISKAIKSLTVQFKFSPVLITKYSM